MVRGADQTKRVLASEMHLVNRRLLLLGELERRERAVEFHLVSRPQRQRRLESNAKHRAVDGEIGGRASILMVGADVRAAPPLAVQRQFPDAKPFVPATSHAEFIARGKRERRYPAWVRMLHMGRQRVLRANDSPELQSYLQWKMASTKLEITVKKIIQLNFFFKLTIYDRKRGYVKWLAGWLKSSAEPARHFIKNPSL